MIDLIKQYVVTDASITRIEQDQYTFDVDSRATKADIKRFFEEYYKVKVMRVNTHRPPSKITRKGQYNGRRPAWKRAIVRLVPGQVLFTDF
jgi:large subunit ribosomal protein L23